MKTVYKGNKVPLSVWCKFAVNFTLRAGVMLLGVLLTYFPMAFLVIFTARRGVSPFGENGVVEHRADYIAQGSSGSWMYFASYIPVIKWFNVYEDGLLGEPSGKHSARVKGREDTFWGMLQWIYRNPFNQFKRTSRFLACWVDECDIEYWGDYDLSDKDPVTEGWYLCQATERDTGRVYYGYRYVKLLKSGKVRHITLGFKIKPKHGNETQDSDDLDKAFTARIQFASEVN